MSLFKGVQKTVFIYAGGLEIFEVSTKTKHLSKFEREDQFLDRVNYTFSVSTDTGSKLLEIQTLPSLCKLTFDLN